MSYKTFEAQAAADKARREGHKLRRECVYCGKSDERTLRGLTRCAACYEREKARRPEQARRIYAFRKQNGLCTKCGKRDAYTMNGRSACADCAERYAEWQRKRYGWKPRERFPEEPEPEIPAAERPDYGMCVFCKAPLAGRKKSNGEPVRVCERCWQRCAENAAAAKRAWYAKRAAREGGG